jgi:hypothetical protein
MYVREFTDWVHEIQHPKDFGLMGFLEQQLFSYYSRNQTDLWDEGMIVFIQI